MTRLLCQQTLLTAKGTNKPQLFRDSASASISPVAQDVWFAQLVIEIKVDAQIVILRVGNELADWSGTVCGANRNVTVGSLQVR